MNIKRIKVLIISIQIAILIFPTVFSVASTINIGDTLHIERGDLGFYTIQYWNNEKEMWMYITYSRTYYTDSDGNKKIAYCMNQDLDGVGWLPGEEEGYDTEVKYKLDDERIWRILKNGYPNVSLESLGVETEDDGYLATKQAIYWIQKNKDLEFIYTHFRPGETEINGQNLEDIKRRGKKVIDAIYKLVEIAYNDQSEAMVNPEIVEVSDFEQDKDEKYYSKTYRITDTKLNSTINITGIDKAPKDTFISDQDGNPKTSFKSGDTFKVMVPKLNILGNNNIKINYEQSIESYPIYYTASKVEGKQNYIILLDKVEKEIGEIDFKINGYESTIKIVKTDEETGKPIEGVTFQIEYNYGVKMGTCTTNKDGIAQFEKLHQGKMIIKEISTDEDYVLDNKEMPIDLGYNETYILNVKNTHKKGNLEIEKVDKENNEVHLEGVEFDLINKDGETVKHIITDNNGKAIVNNVNTGEYILRETKTKEEYKLGVDRNIRINWNETLELKIENEKRKGKIKIIKEDEENENIKLEGIKFEVLNDNDECIQTLVTDENGEATSNDLIVGTYYIKEIETRENYILNDNKIEMQVKEDKTEEIRIKNKKKKGQIKIIKTSEDKNSVLNIEAGGPIANVKFNIYNNKQLVQELETDDNGIAISNKLDIGKYVVQEVATREWYILDEQKYNTEIKENEEIVELKITNKSKNPKVDINKKCKNNIKSNEEIDYTFKIKNAGNTNLENLAWYDILPNKYAKITKIETGTYNQDISYSIYYRTNKKEEYMVIKKNLNSKENNYIDLTNLHLDEDEEIIEIKVCFGNVGVGFESVEDPHILMKIKDGINDEEEIENYTVLEGYNQEYKVSDEDTAKSIIYNIVEKKKLPRTGF